MKILFYIWSLTVGGAERHTLELAAGLRRRGFETAVLVHHGDASADLQVDPEVPVILLHGGGFSNLMGWWKAWRAISQYDFDLLVTVNLSAACVGSLGRTFIHRPQVFVLHSTILQRTIDRLKMAFLKSIRGIQAVVFCSENQKKYWEKKGIKPKNSVTIHNGVDTLHFSPPSSIARMHARNALNIHDDDVVACMLAAFRPEKNHKDFLKAVANVRSKGVPIKALLIGDGPLKENLQSQTKALNIEQQVIFSGQHSDVRPILAAADVGILPSVAVETFSLAALENLSMGIPMIMSSIGGASEIVIPGMNGILIPPRDELALTNALLQASDKTLISFWAQEARRSIVSRYSSEKMLDEYVHFFSSLIR